MKQDRELNNREKLFCIHYAYSADIKRSAQNAGYKKNPQKKGEKLLLRESIVSKVRELISERRKLYSMLAQIGYEKLAFSSVADAVSLLYMDKPDEKQLKDMDLFMISEIKRPKDGAMEIKFFDRLKALDKLRESKESEDLSCDSLMQALSLGAKNLGEQDDENDTF